MRQRILLVLAVLAMLTAQAQTVKVLGRKAAPATFCSGTFQVCDEFASLGSFTQTTGTWSATGGHAVGPTSGNGLLLHNTAAGGATQYVIVRLDTLAGQQGVMVRSNSGEDRAYTVYRAAGTTFWSQNNADGTWIEDLASCSITWAADDYMMVKVSGTGTSTVMEIWKTATMPTAPPSGAATCTLTDNPGFLSDTGTGIGIVSDVGAASQDYDDFAGGGS